MCYAANNFAKTLRLVGDAEGLGIVKVQQLYGEGNAMSCSSTFLLHWACRTAGGPWCQSIQWRFCQSEYA